MFCRYRGKFTAGFTAILRSVNGGKKSGNHCGNLPSCRENPTLDADNAADVKDF